MVASVAKRDSGSIELGDGSELDNSDDDIVSGLGKISYTFGEHHRVEGSYLTFRNTAEEPNNGQGIAGDDIVEKEIQSDTWRAAYRSSTPDDNLLHLDVLAYSPDQQADDQRLAQFSPGPPPTP